MKDKGEDSWSYGGVKRRDFRSDSSGPEEIPHRSPSKKTKRPRKGCPENGNKAHVYTKQESVKQTSRPAMKRVPGGSEIIGRWVSTYTAVETICVGCGHVKNTEYDWEAALNNQSFRKMNMADQHTIGS